MYNPNYNGVYNGPYTIPTTAVPMQQTQTQNTFTWIQGEEAARNYPVAPGNTIVLIEADKPIMYMKSADLSGRPQPMQIRYLVSKEEYEKLQNGSNTTQNEGKYVTKEDFEKYVSEAADKFVIKRRDK